MTDGVGPGRSGENNGLVCGPWQDEAFIVIGVLADEVDPARRDDEDRFPGEVLAKPVGHDPDEFVHVGSLRLVYNDETPQPRRIINLA
jgi:hypothetical protein